MKKTVGALMIAVSAIAYTANANAEKLGNMEYKPYVGIDYSYSRVNAKHFRPSLNSMPINVGVNYNKYFGTEAYFQYSDEYKKSVGLAHLKTQMQSYGLDLMGYLPLGCDNKFSLVGTFGLGDYKAKNKIAGYTLRDSGYGWRYGAGAQYNITENVAVRGIVRYVDVHKIRDVDHLMEYNLGVRYTF